MPCVESVRFSGYIPHEAYFVPRMPLESLRNRDHKYPDPKREEFLRIIKADIERFGLMSPLFCRNHTEKQSLTSGKHRCIVLLELGWTHAPVLVSGPIAGWEPEPIEGVRLGTLEEAQAYLGDGLAFVDHKTNEFWVGYNRPPENGSFHDLHKRKPYPRP